MQDLVTVYYFFLSPVVFPEKNIHAWATMWDGTASFWEAIYINEVMIEKMVNVCFIHLSVVDFIFIIRIEPEDFSEIETEIYWN